MAFVLSLNLIIKFSSKIVNCKWSYSRFFCDSRFLPISAITVAVANSGMMIQDGNSGIGGGKVGLGEFSGTLGSNGLSVTFASLE